MTHMLTQGARATGIALAIATLTLTFPAKRVEAQAKRQTSEAECDIRYTADSGLTEALRGIGFGFEGYDKLCRRLRETDMGVDFTTSSGVLKERSYAWVNVRLYRRSNGVLSVGSRSTTTMSNVADTPEARRALLESANSTLAAIASDPEPYFSSVAAEEARLRSVFAASVKAPSAK